MTKRRFALLVVLSMVVMLVAGAAAAQAAPTKPDGKQDKASLEKFWATRFGNNPASAPSPLASTTDRLGSFKSELLAKAKPDECFYGIGDSRNGPLPCSKGGQSKVDQAYVWGLAKPATTNDLWFGTAPNVHCLVIGGYLGMTDPVQTDSYVCEFGSSRYAQSPYSLPAEIGDWRPPQVFTYNVLSRTLVDKSSLVTGADPYSAGRFNTTLGLRSAGTLGEVVFLAGPGMQGGINLFAFNTNGTFIGSATFPHFTNIRKWLVADGVLYTGVAGQNGGGFILRWTGNATDPFQFAVVAKVDSDAAELAVHEGRMFVGTWPGAEIAGGQAVAGLFMSTTAIPTGGFTGSAYYPTLALLPDAPAWTKVWDANFYEPDPVTAATYGGGALESFGGYLYWGTMHVPLLAAEANLQVYSAYYGPNPTQEQIVAAALGTHRAISIFQGRNFATTPEMQVAYGESSLPVFTPATGWTAQPTKMGAPRYGPSGFGNYFNNYTWTMAGYNNRLFVGTMDWSYLADELYNQLAVDESGKPLDLPVEIPEGNPGADLWAFTSSSAPASAISQDGLGNQTSYGIRTAVVDGALYLGMSNPMNLLKEGGWELIKGTIAK